MAELPELLTVQQVAEILHCSTRTVYRYVKAGTLLAKKGPTQMLITAASLQALIDSFDDAGAI